MVFKLLSYVSPPRGNTSHANVNCLCYSYFYCIKFKSKYALNKKILLAHEKRKTHHSPGSLKELSPASLSKSIPFPLSPLLIVPCSTLNHETCQALPYPSASAHFSHSLGNALSSTSKSFSDSQKLFICHFFSEGAISH